MFHMGASGPAGGKCTRASRTLKDRVQGANHERSQVDKLRIRDVEDLSLVEPTALASPDNEQRHSHSARNCRKQ